jgi:adenosylmethionine-8-amino-7-oxononanoate aminotransferase
MVDDRSVGWEEKNPVIEPATAPLTQGPLFPRKLGTTLPQIASGRGVWLDDTEGRRYLDAAGGCAVVNVGHGVAEIAEAMAQQASTVAYVSGTQFGNAPANELAAALAPHLSRSVPDPRCYFLTTGTDAVEAALKLARQVWVARNRPTKQLFISRSPSYHGCSLATLSLSDRPHYKVPFSPYMMAAHTVPAPQGKGEDHRCVSQLATLIAELGPENIAAFVAEPVSGSSTGAVVPDPDYWPAIQALCAEHDILLIADEVMCGMGRTGRWLACEHFGLQPDIVTLGKGINGGYAPLSAMVAKGEWVETLAQAGQNFLHAGTYSHTPVICAAGLATVRYLETHQLVERSARLGAVLLEKLTEHLAPVATVGAIHGIGLFAGVTFWADAAHQVPFPRSEKFVERLVAAAMAEGLILWPNVGHVNGVDGDLVLIAPPFVITEEEIEQLCHRLVRALNRVEGNP